MTSSPPTSAFGLTVCCIGGSRSTIPHTHTCLLDGSCCANSSRPRRGSGSTESTWGGEMTSTSVVQRPARRWCVRPPLRGAVYVEACAVPVTLLSLPLSLRPLPRGCAAAPVDCGLPNHTPEEVRAQ